MGPEALHELGEEKELSSLRGGRSTRSNFGPAHGSLTLILIKILGLNKLFINVLLIFCLEEKRKQICKVIANNSSQSCQIIHFSMFLFNSQFKVVSVSRLRGTSRSANEAWGGGP